MVIAEAWTFTLLVVLTVFTVVVEFGAAETVAVLLVAVFVVTDDAGL